MLLLREVEVEKQEMAQVRRACVVLLHTQSK